MKEAKVHRGFSKLYAKFIHHFSGISYYLFAGGEKFSELILGLVDINKGKRILDIGCGVGSLLFDIEEAIDYEKRLENNGKLIVGIDRSKEMIKIARKKAQKDNKKIDFIICDACNLPFKSCTIDICFNTLFLHHLPPKMKERVMNETCRVLRMEGNYVLMDLDRPTSIIGWSVAFLRWHVFTIRTNFKYGLKYLINKAGLKIESHNKKLGLFSYYGLKRID